MQHIRLLSFIGLIAFISGINLFASSVTLSMYQQDFDPATIRETSRMIENKIMDVYFESGYIITNVPISGQYDKTVSAVLALTHAQEGVSDYLVLVSLVYTDGSRDVTAKGVVSDIAYADWQLIDVLSGKLLSSGKLKPAQGQKQELNNIAGINDFAILIAKTTADSIAKLHIGRKK